MHFACLGKTYIVEQPFFGCREVFSWWEKVRVWKLTAEDDEQRWRLTLYVYRLIYLRHVHFAIYIYIYMLLFWWRRHERLSSVFVERIVWRWSIGTHPLSTILGYASAHRCMFALACYHMSIMTDSTVLHRFGYACLRLRGDAGGKAKRLRKMSKHVLISNIERRPGRKGFEQCQNMSLFQTLRDGQDEKT